MKFIFYDGWGERDEVNAEYVSSAFNKTVGRYEIIFHRKNGNDLKLRPKQVNNITLDGSKRYRVIFKIGDDVEFEADCFELAMDGNYYFYFYKDRKKIHQFKATNVLKIEGVEENKKMNYEPIGVEIIIKNGKSDLYGDVDYFNIIYPDFSSSKPNIYLKLKSGQEISYSAYSYDTFKIYVEKEAWEKRLNEKRIDMSKYKLVLQYGSVEYIDAVSYKVDPETDNVIFSNGICYKLKGIKEFYEKDGDGWKKTQLEIRGCDFAKGDSMTDYTKYVYSAGRTNGKSVKGRGIEKVIFNPPATIVMWNDGTKTVVKCMEGDEFSPETGLAMCVAKKYFGSGHKIKKMCESYYKEQEEREKLKKMLSMKDKLEPCTLTSKYIIDGNVTKKMCKEAIEDFKKAVDSYLAKCNSYLDMEEAHD